MSSTGQFLHSTNMNATTMNVTRECDFDYVLVFLPINVIALLLVLSLNIYVIILLLLPGLGEFDSAEVFTLNLAISEILFTIIGPLEWLGCIYVELSVSKPIGFISGLCMSARPMMQCCVCLERYLAVVHPLTFLRYKQPRYRVAHSLMAWTAILAVAILCAITYPDMPFVAFGSIYMLVLAVEFFCCMSILKKLRHPGPGESERQEREMNSFKRKAFQVVVMNLLTFCIQILPTAIILCVQSKLQMKDILIAMGINMLINIFTGFVQPLFVLHKAGKLSICFPKNRRP